MQARLFSTALTLVLSLGTGIVMAQPAQGTVGSIDIQGSRTKFTGSLKEASMIMDITTKNVGTKKGGTITITREVDAASPKLYDAYNSKEALPKVIFKVYKPGDPTKYKIVTLEGAIITKVVKGVKQPTSAKPNPNTHKENDTSEMENVSFTFTAIMVENLGGSTSASDDWTSNNQ